MVDLRSDTVTKPTPGMRAAMAAAEVGDDVYGEDPSINALQERVAALFGHEAALLAPTGSMANQIALQSLVPPGSELLCDADAHIVTYESGATAAIGGISTRTWPAVGADLDVEQVAAMIRPAGYYAVDTCAIAVEQTHNKSGGGVIPLSTLEDLRRAADEAGVALHADGARIWHASIADGVPPHRYGALFDTMSVCLSKGLGAPVGSLVVSSAERIARARLIRKRMGGGMRQAGVLAAAGDYALTHQFERLAEDHAKALRLAEALAPFGVVDPARVRTNMVVVDLGKSTMDAKAFAGAAAERGVLFPAISPQHARLVTHLDVDEAGIDEAIEVLTGILAAGAS
ncbi:MAG TPA: GntG family PLP-dependent aldolase [Rugosimonospora sp.]|nr:GntG family PLP-dependent aldolase [Rugosimonospora sp.]